MDATIIFSKRRTILLTVNRYGKVVVHAPHFAKRRTIQEFIERQRDWISQALHRYHANRAKPKLFVSGERFWYLGQQYPLVISDEYRSRLLFDGSTFLLSRLKTSQGKSLFLSWYKKQAQAVLLERMNLYSAAMGVSYNKITIRQSVTRWGSCSSTGSINFSYRLIMAPVNIIDYVVVHELAHIVQHNHSKKFWQLVYQFCPQFQDNRRWLRKNGNLLEV